MKSANRHWLPTLVLTFFFALSAHACDLAGTWTRYEPSLNAPGEGMKTTWKFNDKQLESTVQQLDYMSTTHGAYCEYKRVYQIEFQVPVSSISGVSAIVASRCPRPYLEPYYTSDKGLPETHLDWATSAVAKQISYSVRFSDDCSQVTFNDSKNESLTFSRER